MQVLIIRGGWVS